MTKIFAERLKEARLAAGLTRPELAEKSGVSKNTIFQVEHAMHIPNLYTIVALTDALGVSLDWLVGRDNYASKDA